MAKIKVSGINDYIEVNNNDLKDFVKNKTAGNIRNEDIINFGRWGGTASQIKSWILDEERIEENLPRKMFFEWLDERKRLLALSSKERAEGNFNYIALIYYVFTGKDLRLQEPTIRNNLLKLSEDYFEREKQRARPSLLIFKQLKNEPITIDKDASGAKQRWLGQWLGQLWSGALRLLERMEQSEIEAVNYDNKQYDGKVFDSDIDYPKLTEEPVF